MTDTDAQAARIHQLAPGLIAVAMRDDDTKNADVVSLLNEMLGWRLETFNPDDRSRAGRAELERQFGSLAFTFGAFANVCGELITILCKDVGADPLQLMAVYAAKLAED